MFDPILELSNRLHWDGVMRETFSIAPEPRTNRIPPPSRLVNSNILLVGCRSSLAKPNWKFGLEVAISLLASPDTFSEFPAGMALFDQKISLNRPTLVYIPNYEPKPYLATFSIPYWHKEMYVEVWQYSGPQSSDIKDTLGQILSEVQQ